MAAIDRIIITRDTHGAEPHLHFAISDKQALHDALQGMKPQSSRLQMFAQLLVRMSGFSGRNLPPDWKDIFCSGEPFSWEFVPQHLSE